MKFNVLINKSNLLSEDFIPEFLYTTDENKNNFHQYKDPSKKSQIDSRIYRYFLLMQEDALKEGIVFLLDSGYRSYEYQQVIWDKMVEEYGLKYTENTVASPGASEHQSGLAFDIGLFKDAIYTEDILETDKEAIWLEKNSYKYGFILRYPKGKENITGYSYEPWHYRFVGVPLATIIKTYNITLEEYYLNKTKYDKIARVIKEPSFFTTYEFIACLLLLNSFIDLRNFKKILKNFQRAYPNLEYYSTPIDCLNKYINISENSINLKQLSEYDFKLFKSLANTQVLNQLFDYFKENEQRYL